VSKDMANNRMYLICAECKKNGRTNYSFFIAKYYPSNGWYVPGDENRNLTKDLNEFLDTHSHPGSGNGLTWETDEVPFSLNWDIDKERALTIRERVQEALSKWTLRISR